MRAIRKVTRSYEETLALGSRFAKVLKRGDIVCLFGDLGSGKTAFTKGVAKGLKIKAEEVHSPTFTLMNIYEGRIPVYHFDLYRIESPDLLGLGYEEFFYGNGVAVIEWSEKLGAFLPAECWKIEFKHAGEDVRKISLSFKGEGFKERFGKVIKTLNENTSR